MRRQPARTRDLLRLRQQTAAQAAMLRFTVTRRTDVQGRPVDVQLPDQGAPLQLRGPLDGPVSPGQQEPQKAGQPASWQFPPPGSVSSPAPVS